MADHRVAVREDVLAYQGRPRRDYKEPHPVLSELDRVPLEDAVVAEVRGEVVRLVDEKHEAEVGDRSEFPTVVEDLLDEDLAQEILGLVRLQHSEVDDVHSLPEDGFRAEGRLLRVEDLR